MSDIGDKLTPMLERLVEKVSKMRPIPPCDSPRDKSWEKVDKLILKVMKTMKEKGFKRPLHPLSETLLDMACKDLIDNNGVATEAVQALAFRVFDTRLLVDEFSRMKKIAVGIREEAKGRKVEEGISPHFPPQNAAFVPPCLAQDRRLYDDSAAAITKKFANELRWRGMLPAKKG